MRILALLLLAACGGSHQAAASAAPSESSPPIPPPGMIDAGADPAEPTPADAATEVRSGPGTGGGPQDVGTYDGPIRGPASPPIGNVSVGIPSGTSGLDPEVIRRVMRTRRGVMLRCYKLQRDRDPKPAGTVALHLEVTPEGKVSAATASGISTELDDCLSRVMPLVSFPQAVGTSRIDISLTFSPP